MTRSTHACGCRIEWCRARSGNWGQALPLARGRHGTVCMPDTPPRSARSVHAHVTSEISCRRRWMRVVHIFGVRKTIRVW